MAIFKDLDLGVSQATVAFKVIDEIATRWGLSDSQLAALLGGVGTPAIQEWRDQFARRGHIESEVQPDVLDRISYLIGIYSSLHDLFVDRTQANAWISKANSAPGFNRGSALNLMLSGRLEDLLFVRHYLAHGSA